jgi:hypothetical protein
MTEKAQVWRYYRYDDYAVLQTLESVPVNVGDKLNVSGVDGTFNGNNKLVVNCPQYRFIGVDTATGDWLFDYTDPIPNQVMYQSTGDDKDISALTTYGLIIWEPEITWITDADLTKYLDIPLTSTNAATLITQSVKAANRFAFRRRQESGYLTDVIDEVPNEAVFLGTLMIAAAYFRQQGSYTALASFDGMGVPPANGVTPMVLQLLGVNRPQVA